MKNCRSSHIWLLLLLLLAALIALPVTATEDEPANGGGNEPAPVTTYISDPAPVNKPDESAPAVTDTSGATQSAPVSDTGSEQTRRPAEGTLEQGEPFANGTKTVDEPDAPAETMPAQDVQTPPEEGDTGSDSPLPEAPAEPEPAPAEPTPAPTEAELPPAPVEEEPTLAPMDVEQTEVAYAEPRVEVECAFDGDELVEGAKVTMTARVYNIPEGTALSFQWQNNATGKFEDVQGATERVYIFYADAATSGCQWRVRVEGKDA